MIAPEDITDTLEALASRTNAATPYVRVDGELLRRARNEILSLRAEIKGRQARVQAKLFDEGAQ